MNSINDIDFTCFYFNNHYSDEFGVIAAGTNPLQLSGRPSKTTKVETVLGKDGDVIVSSQFNPRTFPTDITITDMSRFREIIGWLSCPAQDFWWKNDDVKISAMVDDNVLDTQVLGFMEYQGQQNKATILPLKFICHDPYYYCILDKHYTFTQSATPLITTTDGYNINIAGNLSTGIRFNNDGNKEAFSLIKINGSGNIVANINGNSISMNNINSFIYIDLYSQSVYKDLLNLETNQFNDYQGAWFSLNAGINTVQVVSGMCTSVEVFCRSRYI